MIGRCKIGIFFAIAFFGFAKSQGDPLINSESLAEKIANNPSSLTILHVSFKNCSDYAKEHIVTALCLNGLEALNKFKLPNAVDFAR